MLSGIAAGEETSPMALTYSLWLVPDGEVQASMARTIAELAEQHGGPIFSPHITLLGGLQGTEDEILRLASRIVEQIPPLDVEFEGLGAEDVYFRSLYLVARPTLRLVAANQIARRLSCVDPAEPFRPHLSLIYGMYRAETKRAIVQSLGGHLPSDCHIARLEVWRTDQPVERWELTRQMRLTGQPSP